MTSDWLFLLTLWILAATSYSLPTDLLDDAKKTDRILKSKPKRVQESLMFGNQQNRQAHGAANSYVSTAEKRALSAAGLDDSKSSGEDKFADVKSPGDSPSDRDAFVPYDKNYEYDKLLVNGLEDSVPRAWDVSPYSRYYAQEDRQKRSEKSNANVQTTVPPTSTTSIEIPLPTQRSLQAQAKRSIAMYSEPRYKREADIEIDPETVWTLLSLWENRHRKRNWRKYANEDYDNMEDDNGLIEEEDPRNVLAWMNGSAYSPYRYGTNPLSPSDIGIVRTHPPSYYEQYENQYGQQYDNGVSSPYGNEYAPFYSQRTYYPPEKRFMVTRKRSSSYDPYVSGAQLQLASQSRGYPSYQHHMVY